MTTSDFKFFSTRFVATFAIFVMVFFAIFYYDATNELATSKSNIKAEQKALLEGKKDYIESVIGSVVKETALLADLLSQQEVYLAENNPDLTSKTAILSRVNNTLVSMSQRKEIYDQIRYLDLNGNEVVRINFKDGRANVVAHTQLQNKAHRYYFEKAKQLDCNQVYVSPLDLNIEHGAIELPYKPTIRMAAPVFDQQGNKRGIVIINYLADYLMDGLRLFNLNSGTNYMLVNRDGYYLFNEQQPESEFAFMFDDKKDLTVYSQFPSMVKQLKQTVSGQFETADGIMTIESVGSSGNETPYCFQDSLLSNNDTTAWKIVSYAEFDKRLDVKHPLSLHDTLMRIGVLLSLILAYFMARYQLRLHQDNQRIHYLARYDFLTKLLNRGAFQTELESLIQSARKTRTSLCLIYIDLDDFKGINDQFGHAAGDKALIHVAQAMQHVFGEQAIMGRLGGDEFAVILQDNTNGKDAQCHASTLLELVQQPTEVARNVCLQFNASIGGYFCCGEKCDQEELMHKADSAMYQAKKEGKNRVIIVE
ncbi:GGDEF domain-containing protein [Vibrio sp. 404]|uniref:GGDEF domain-containing protein n=1 Tax=Vibrio marinisediminis TaxID=2758441 RepID=A0A7W2FPR1_9VIBR|nr:sensor domain-containing diguanylate cyclase [Vibrio marinisediminis]MBA5761981.1 GGDEF domain-containing protein [Vibrio marinisediminis]